MVILENNHPIPPSELLGVTRFEEINGEHYLEITTTREIEKGTPIALLSKVDNVWREYMVSSTEEVHEQDLIARKYRCVWSLQGLLSTVPSDAMPGTGGTPATARAALEALLQNTTAFEIGTVEPTTTGSASFWRMTAWEGLAELVKNWGGEVTTDFNIFTHKRTINIVNRQGARAAFIFAYGDPNISNVTRSRPDDALVCRVIPLGAAQQTDAGGYGRKVDITSVNGGIPYIEDAEKAAEYEGSPVRYPTAYIENSKITDPAELKTWCESVLYSITRPDPYYTVELTECFAPNVDYIPTLGDLGSIVDKELGAFSVRITSLSVDEMALSVSAKCDTVAASELANLLARSTSSEFSYLARLPLTSAATDYSSDEYAIYSRDGRTVSLFGAVKLTEQLEAQGSVIVGKLPEGYRPAVKVVSVCQGSGASVFTLQVYPSGDVGVSRYRNGATYQAISTSAWLPLNATFQI